jgi:hypothetical protein
MHRTDHTGRSLFIEKQVLNPIKWNYTDFHLERSLVACIGDSVNNWISWFYYGRRDSSVLVQMDL